MYTLNFSIGPKLPSHYPIVNELLLSSTHPCLRGSEKNNKKTSYTNSQIVIAIGISLLATAGAAWALYDPSLLPKIFANAKPAISSDEPSRSTNSENNNSQLGRSNNLPLPIPSQKNPPIEKTSSNTNSQILSDFMSTPSTFATLAVCNISTTFFRLSFPRSKHLPFNLLHQNISQSVTPSQSNDKKNSASGTSSLLRKKSPSTPPSSPEVKPSDTTSLKTPTNSLSEFMKNLQDKASHLVIRETINAIQSDLITRAFKDITTHLVTRVLKKIRATKESRDEYLSPALFRESVTQGIHLKNTDWTKTSPATKLIFDWLQTNLQKALRNPNKASSYSDFTLTKADTPLIRQAIYGNIRIKLEQAMSTLSTEQKLELQPYIDTCKDLETSTLFDDAFNALIEKNSKKSFS